MDERKRDSIIAYLRHRMAEFGIEPNDLAAAIAQDQLRQKAALYRSAAGDTWDGVGEMPQWLKQAAGAGQSLEHFAVGKTVPAPTGRTADWSSDPFSGTRLAKTNRSESSLA